MPDPEPIPPPERPQLAAPPAEPSTSVRSAYLQLAVAVVGLAAVVGYLVYRGVAPSLESILASRPKASAPKKDPPVVRQGRLDEAARAETERRPTSSVPAGVLVVRAVEGTPSYDAGLRSGDVITAYNGEIVGSDISYKYARERRERSGARDAEVIVNRAGTVVQVTVPTGMLLFDGADCTDLLDRINVEILLGNTSEAERLLVEGLQSRVLGRAEELLVRIWMIPDAADRAAEARRAGMLEELASMCIPDDLGGFASIYFFKRRHAAGAAYFTRKMLATDPDDVSLLLNLALYEAHTGRFDESDRVVRSVLDRDDPGLSSYGYGIAYTSCAYVAFGRGQYEAATRYFREAIDRTGCADDWDKMNRYLVAAARVGLPEFRAARDHVFQDGSVSSAYAASNGKLLECYALVLAGDRDGALRIAKDYPRSLPQEMLAQFERFPEGADVVAKWSSLRP